MSQLSAQDEAARHQLRRTALLVVCLGAFITPLMLASVNVALLERLARTGGKLSHHGAQP